MSLAELWALKGESLFDEFRGAAQTGSGSADRPGAAGARDTGDATDSGGAPGTADLRGAADGPGTTGETHATGGPGATDRPATGRPSDRDRPSDTDTPGASGGPGFGAGDATADRPSTEGIPSGSRSPGAHAGDSASDPQAARDLESTHDEVLIGAEPRRRGRGRQFALPAAAMLLVGAVLAVTQGGLGPIGPIGPAGSGSGSVAVQDGAPAGSGPGAQARTGANAAGTAAGGTAGAAAPVPKQLAFTARTLQGGTFSGASLAGKPAVMWFWAPWCAVCLGEASSVLDMAERFGDRVTFVGMAGRDSEQNMQQFVDQTGIGSLPQVIDADGELWSSFEVSGQPSYVFIDRAGKTRVVAGALTPDQLYDLTAKIAR
jgi:thiol-disulfide isomerase/thioredoxin